MSFELPVRFRQGDEILEAIAALLVKLDNDSKNQARVVLPVERACMEHRTQGIDKGDKVSTSLDSLDQERPGQLRIPYLDKRLF